MSNKFHPGDSVNDLLRKLLGNLSRAGQSVHDRLRLLLGAVEAESANPVVRVLATQNTAVSHTGDTAETTLFTVTLPGGTLGPNGFLRVTISSSQTNNANTKSVRVRLNGAMLAQGSAASGNSYVWQRTTSNRNSESSQITGIANSSSSYASSGSGSLVTAEDTSVDLPLTVSVALSNSADTLTLDQVLVEYCYIP